MRSAAPEPRRGGRERQGTAPLRGDNGGAAFRTQTAQGKTRAVPPGAGMAGIPVLTLLLAAFGVLMVHSAGWYTAQEQYGDAFYFLKKQLLGFALGAAAMFAAGFFPYQKLKN